MHELDISSQNNDLSEWIQSQHKALRQYCCSLTGSSWEGEDLAQETWLKVWSAINAKEGHTLLARSYLYRTARNSWIDRGRRKGIKPLDQPLDDLPLAEQQHDYITMWTAMETLVNQLAPNQRIALLLVDVLKYTAAESAELLNTTEGAVKAALHRARVKLRKLADEDNHKDNSKEIKQPKVLQGHSSSSKDDHVIYAYMEAFRQQNTAALIMLMNDAYPMDIVPMLVNKAQVKPERTAIQRTDNQHSSVLMAA
ncbi:ECF RNA polymerase sigma factor SigG [compost metagenome]